MNVLQMQEIEQVSGGFSPSDLNACQSVAWFAASFGLAYGVAAVIAPPAIPAIGAAMAFTVVAAVLQNSVSPGSCQWGQGPIEGVSGWENNPMGDGNGWGGGAGWGKNPMSDE